MSLILSIETSTNGCSAALHSEGSLISNSELFAERSSAEMLTTLIKHVLFISKKTFDDLDALAISKGPGSYTGLRIGVSTAKGICFAKDIPLISVNSLDIMVDQIPKFYNGLICPMLDARRMEVYCKVVNHLGQVYMPTSAKIVDESAFEEYLLEHKVLFCGEGADKCKQVIHNANALFLGKEVRPKAADMGKMAFEKVKTLDYENLSEFEPFYLKEFVGTIPTKNKKVTA
ncbi:MAG: tRNA threonylcarbamoyladenosine biosynthesis protein TsaB [Algoriphagus sp.]|jgi:tRNA threonylcarbamoyladenosine biosynthesis protein TsaB